MNESEFNRYLQKYISTLSSVVNDPGKAKSLAVEFEDKFKVGYNIFSFCNGLRGDFVYYNDEKITDKTKEERWKTNVIMPSQLSTNESKCDLRIQLGDYEIIFYKEEKDYMRKQDYSNPYSTTPVTRLIEVFRKNVLVFNPSFHYEWLPSSYEKPFFFVFKPSEWIFDLLSRSITYLDEKKERRKQQDVDNAIYNLLP